MPDLFVISQSVDSSLGGLSRSSTVASLDTESTKSSGTEAGGLMYRRRPLADVHVVLPGTQGLVCLGFLSPLPFDKSLEMAANLVECGLRVWRGW